MRFVLAVSALLLASRVPSSMGANSVCGTDLASRCMSLTETGTGSTATYTLKSNGCPGYDWTKQTTPNDATTNNIAYTFLQAPKVSSTPTKSIGVYTDLAKATQNSKPPLGALGLAVNGATIYGNADNAGVDAYVWAGRSFDPCRGHATPEGYFHYHTDPAAGCVYTNVAGQHSPLFGIMADGIPIFGSKGDNGTLPTDLDECGGHKDNSYPFYHYHVQDALVYPYTINCLKGCAATTGTCTESSTSYNWTTFMPLVRSTFQAAMVGQNSTCIPGALPGEGLSGTVIGLIAAGVILGVILIAGGGFLYFKKYRNRTMKASPVPNDSTAEMEKPQA